MIQSNPLVATNRCWTMIWPKKVNGHCSWRVDRRVSIDRPCSLSLSLVKSKPVLNSLEKWTESNQVRKLITRSSIERSIELIKQIPPNQPPDQRTGSFSSVPLQYWIRNIHFNEISGERSLRLFNLNRHRLNRTRFNIPLITLKIERWWINKWVNSEGWPIHSGMEDSL